MLGKKSVSGLVIGLFLMQFWNVSGSIIKLSFSGAAHNGHFSFREWELILFSWSNAHLFDLNSGQIKIFTIGSTNKAKEASHLLARSY